MNIHSLLLRFCTARGSGTWLSLVDPTKVKACNSFLFTEISLVFKIRNTSLIFVITFILWSLCFIALHQLLQANSWFRLSPFILFFPVPDLLSLSAGPSSSSLLQGFYNWLGWLDMTWNGGALTQPRLSRLFNQTNQQWSWCHNKWWRKWEVGEILPQHSNLY